MTSFAAKSALREKFTLPVALSLGLHGLAAAGLGAFALFPGQPAPEQAVFVNLLATPAQPVASAKPEPRLAPPPASVPKARALVQRTAATPARPRHNVQPVLVKPSMAMIPRQSAAAASPAQAVFMELPRTLAPAAAPAAFHFGKEDLTLPESMEVPDALPGAAGAAFSRELPASSSGARLLRDTAAETGSVSRVRLGNNPRPEYPRTAREAGWEGTVVLQVLVLPDGTAGSVSLHRTSGHPVLDEAALSSVKNWKFLPAMDGNFPVQSVVRLPVRFDLKSAN